MKSKKNPSLKPIKNIMGKLTKAIGHMKTEKPKAVVVKSGSLPKKESLKGLSKHLGGIKRTGKTVLVKKTPKSISSSRVASKPLVKGSKNIKVQVPRAPKAKVIQIPRPNKTHVIE